jgi:hypothetical protein
MQDIATRNAFLQGEPLWRWLRGWVHVQQGNFEAGYALLVEGYRQHLQVHLLTGATSVLAHAADSAARGGRLEDARRHLADGFAMAKKTGERLFMTDLMMAQARIAQAEGHLDAARNALRAALGEARAQEAAWLEFEARVALCELTDAGDDDVEALRALCAERQDGRDTALFQKALSLAT